MKIDESVPHKGTLENWAMLVVPLKPKVGGPVKLHYALCGDLPGKGYRVTTPVLAQAGMEVQTATSRYTLGRFGGLAALAKLQTVHG